MHTDEEFSNLLRGLRASEAESIRRFVETYEPYLRRTLRRRLRNTQLQAIVDSVDLCQSVLGVFLIRFTAGEFEVTTPDHLSNLLMGIAKKKYARLVRREAAQRRDRSITQPLGSDPNLVDTRFEEPSIVLQRNELLSDIQRRMSDCEREIFQMRQEGHSWDAIASIMGEPVARLRKRFSRAIARVCEELKLEADDE